MCQMFKMVKNKGEACPPGRGAGPASQTQTAAVLPDPCLLLSRPGAPVGDCGWGAGATIIVSITRTPAGGCCTERPYVF